MITGISHRPKWCNQITNFFPQKFSVLVCTSTEPFDTPTPPKTPSVFPTSFQWGLSVGTSIPTHLL